ncbi:MULTISPECIES: hypothetical protein [Amycolatopsis]|uniref:Excreted virulence factor EspC, type VII ESX diderm n=1 Tax=Amycolatopsis bullii TaxID=941987 RepID=A0ABQ3KKS0_9PSEU|nr:hypothetical protein [Amycolatopsis bullii]GHG33364.1 hypothetical protein GCM10017567_62050 [Amycolatopsis bullii]
MSLDGPGFHVEIELLEAASKNMAQIVRDQDGFELRGLCGEAEIYGHQGVHSGLAEFCGRWSVGLDALADRAERMGDTLGEAAKVYRGVDEANAESLKEDPAVDAVDPPAFPGGAV